MEHSCAYLSLFGKVADEGGGAVGGERGAEGIKEGVGQQITTNIRFSRCHEIDTHRHESAVTVVMNRRSELPRGALNRHTAYNSFARTSAQRTYNNDYQPITPHNPVLTKRVTYLEQFLRLQRYKKNLIYASIKLKNCIYTYFFNDLTIKYSLTLSIFTAPNK